MKLITKIPYVIFLLCIFTMWGCEKEIEVKDPIISTEFKLLDDNKQSKFVFEEGENITFYFKIKTDDPKWKFMQMLNNDSNFFRIYKKENGNLLNIGISHSAVDCDLLYYYCGRNTPYIYELPWITGKEMVDEPDLNSFPPFCLFNTTSHLTSGNYISYFDEVLEFVHCGDTSENGEHEKTYFTTDLLHFKIEFEVK